MNAWFDKLYETFIESGLYDLLFEGVYTTLLITLGALLIGVVIGSLIAVVKYFGEDVPALKPICWLCDLYVTVIRGIPVVVLLLIFFFIVLKSSSGIVVGIVTFGINSGAYMAELIRSGLNAVDAGQMEAGQDPGHGQDHLPPGRPLHSPRHLQRNDRPFEGNLGSRLRGCC